MEQGLKLIMARNLFARYVWMVDTIGRYGKISRSELNRLWMRSSLSNGDPMPERTFHNYRRAIEQNFNLDILCDSLGNYSLKTPAKQSTTFSNWLLDSYAVSSALSDASAVASKVMVEDVPSARRFLPIALDAIGQLRVVIMEYEGFNRSRAESGISFEPHFVRLYRQRWYVVGRRRKSGDIRTYALDRVREMLITDETFILEEGEDDPQAYFSNIIGITYSKASPRRVRIKTSPTQAKYLRALPMHESQSELLGDGYSIFSYNLKLNYELVHELVGMGSSVEVLEPRELRVMVADELRRALDNYQ